MFPGLLSKNKFKKRMLQILMLSSFSKEEAEIQILYIKFWG